MPDPDFEPQEIPMSAGYIGNILNTDLAANKIPGSVEKFSFHFETEH